MHREPGEAPDQLGNRRGRLLPGGDGDGVAVVSDDVEHGQPLVAGRVQALPELPLRGGAFSKRDVGEFVFVRAAPGKTGPAMARDVPACLSTTDGRYALRTSWARLGHDVKPAVTPVRGHLPAPRRWVVGGTNGLQQHLRRLDTERKYERPVPVVGEEPVVAGPQRAGQAHAQGFMASPRNMKEASALFLQDDFAVVDAAGYQGHPVILDQLGNGHAAVFARGFDAAWRGRHQPPPKAAWNPGPGRQRRRYPSSAGTWTIILSRWRANANKEPRADNTQALNIMASDYRCAQSCRAERPGRCALGPFRGARS